MANPKTCASLTKPAADKVIPHLSEEQVKEYLNWEDVYKAVESAMLSVAEGKSSQPARTFTVNLDNNGLLLAMPGYFQNETYGGLACKLITIFKHNVKNNLLPILANIIIFDRDTGAMDAIVAGTEITAWRTAAASAVFTKRVYKPCGTKKGILGVIGIGKQGTAHAEGFYNYFEWSQIRLCNRTHEKAEKFAKEMNEKYKLDNLFVAVKTNEECVRGADVIVTATFATEPVVLKAWLKKNAIINAVGATAGVHDELEACIYDEADIYVDHYSGANSELKGLLEKGHKFKGEVGGLINGTITPTPGKITIFQSLGMAVEDVAVARLVYDLYKSRNNK